MTRKNPRRLTPAQVERFRLDGCLSVEDVLTADEVAALGQHADRIAAGELDHIPGDSIQLEPVFSRGEKAVADKVLSVRKLFKLAVYDEVMWAHVTHPRIADMAADLLGTDDIKLYSDQLFMKGPRTGSAQVWHQDSASWRDIFPMDLVTAWTAIDAATVDNGCLNFAIGTHRWGLLRGERLHPFVADMESGLWPVRPAPLRPGGVSFHHSLTLHQSNANRSGMRRRGYAVHYMRATSWRDLNVTGVPKVPPFRQVRGRSFPGRV